MLHISSYQEAYGVCTLLIVLTWIDLVPRVQQGCEQQEKYGLSAQDPSPYRAFGAERGVCLFVLTNSHFCLKRFFLYTLKKFLLLNHCRFTARCKHSSAERPPGPLPASPTVVCASPQHAVGRRGWRGTAHRTTGEGACSQLGQQWPRGLGVVRTERCPTPHSAGASWSEVQEEDGRAHPRLH